MIFFVANDGTIVKSLATPVYQGSVNANKITLIAPFADGLTAAVAFQLPNGVSFPPYPMTYQNVIPELVNQETGIAYGGWTYDIPFNITEHYGTVTAQFYFYEKQSGAVIATSATSFQVARGVTPVNPSEPSEDVWREILIILSSLQSQLNDGVYAARAIYAWNSAYIYDVNEITFYPSIGTFGAFVKSKIDKNTNPPYIEGNINNAAWEEVVDFNTISSEYFESVQNAVDEAKAAAKDSSLSALSAEKSAEKLRDVSSRIVRFVPELPEVGDPQYIYAVVSDADTNLFELWAWVDGVKTFFGSANVVADSDSVYAKTLVRSEWLNNSQTIEVAEANTDKRVVVMPVDASAAEYISCNVTPVLKTGAVEFACSKVPSTDILVLIQVITKREIKNLAEYYTKPQTDELLAQKQSVTDTALNTSDKTVVGAINENKTEIDGLRADIVNEAHFRGYAATNAEVMQLQGDLNDYAYSAQSGTVWIYGAGGWADSKKRVPDQTVPASNATPLMDGTAAVGEDTAYARGTHRHPTDTSRAAASDLSAEIAERKTEDAKITERLDNAYGSSVETLKAEGWNNNQQTLNIPRVTALGGLNVYPTDESAAAYIIADIYITQTNGKIVFSCTSVPNEKIDVVVETFN